MTTEAALDESAAPDTSLRDTITAAYDEVASTIETGGEGAAPKPPAPSAEVKTESQPAGDRARGPDGRFIEKSQEPEPKTAKAPDQKPTQAAPKDGQPQQASPPAAALETMSPADRAVVSKFAPEAQAFVAQREKHWNEAMATAGRKVAGHLQQLADYQNVVAPYEQELAKHGMTAPAAIKQLLAIRDHAVKDPAGYIKWFADGHKIDLSQLGAQKTDEFVDPQVKALQTELAQIKQGLSSTQTAQARADEDRIVSGIVNAMQQFAATKNEDGSLAYPLFDKVRDSEMAFIAEKLRAAYPNAPHHAIMDAAYKRAVWLNPETREIMLKQQVDAAEAKRQKDIADHAAQARRASTPVRGAPGGPPASAQPPADDLRGELLRAWDAHQGGARA